MKFLFFLRSYWKSLTVIAGILYLSFAPPSTFTGVPSFPNEDKLVHIFLYGCLANILIFDFRNYKKLLDNRFAFILYCIALPILLGGMVEILQPMYFAPRTAEWFDWFSDITGTMLGWAFMSILKLTPQYKSKK